MDFANISNVGIVEYLPVILFIIIALVLIIGIIIVSYVVTPQKPTYNKNLPYECGFDSLSDARQQIDVRFYLIAVLFIIFDLEIIFMYPWAVSLYSVDDYGFFSMILFSLMLLIGFIYEWRKEALQWD